MDLRERRGFRKPSRNSVTRLSPMIARFGRKRFGLCYLKNQREAKFYGEIIEHLNHLPPQDGWFTANYGGAVGRQIFGGNGRFQKALADSQHAPTRCDS